ncbi:MAG: hypothetical protein ACO3IN_12280 [Steroidobacteraceae bacterium]
MAGGRPSTLTDDVIAKAQQMADLGLPYALMPSRIGVPPATWKRWIKNGRDADESTNEGRLWAVINNGASKLAESYLQSLHGQAELGNVNAITWLLTHHPILRDNFSDAAATRREVQATLQAVVQAIQGSDLTPEQQDHLLLRMQAAGLGTPAG